MNERSFRFWQWGIVAAALAVRLPQLNGSFWLDEAAQALESARPLSQQLALTGDFQPPLYHLLVAGLVRFSTAEWWLRLGSVIPAILTVWLVIRLARRWLSREGSILAGAAVAFSGLHVFYSQELRPYSLAVLWAVLAWNFLEQRQWRRFSLAVAIGLLTSYIYLFWLPALLAVALVQRQGKAAVKAGAVSGLFFLAWWPSFLGQLRAGQQLRLELPGWELVVSLPQLKALILVPAKFLIGVLPLDLVWWQILLVGGALGLLAIAISQSWWFAGRAERKSSGKWLMLLVVPGLLAWLVSFVTPVLQPKRVLWLILPISILLGWIGQSRAKVGRIAVGAFFAWQAISLAGYWTQPQLQRENWREAIHQIDSQFSPTNTVVVFGFDYPFAPWEWYPHQDYATFSTGLSPLRELDQARLNLRGVENYRYVIVFDYLRDLTDPYRLIEARLAEMKYRRLGEYTYPNLGIIRVFEQNQLYAEAQYGPS